MVADAALALMIDLQRGAKTAGRPVSSSMGSIRASCRMGIRSPSHSGASGEPCRCPNVWLPPGYSEQNSPMSMMLEFIRPARCLSEGNFGAELVNINEYSYVLCPFNDAGEHLALHRKTMAIPVRQPRRLLYGGMPNRMRLVFLAKHRN